MLSRTSILGILLSALCAISMWFYVDRVLVPFQIVQAAAQGEPRGNLSDLYPRWLGTRELLLHGRDPYSAEVTREIQAGYYGRSLDPANSSDPKDQQGFAYPIYVVFLLAPTIHLPFSIVQKGFYWLLWLLTAGGVLLWLRALNWSPNYYTKTMLVVFTLGSLPAVQGLKLQQLSLLVAALLAASLAAAASGYLTASGILLASATIKPQLAWMPALWMCCWALRDLRRRKRFLWGFGGTIFSLLIGAQIVLPGWMERFYVAVHNYHQYTHNLSIISKITTPWIGGTISILLIAAVAAWCWPHLHDDPDSRDFGIMVCLVMTTTVIVVPMFAPYNQVLLLPAILFVVRDYVSLWQGRRAVRAVFVITAILLVWPWLTTLGIMAASSFLRETLLQSAWRLPLYNNFSFPLVLFLLLALSIPTFQKQPKIENL